MILRKLSFRDLLFGFVHGEEISQEDLEFLEVSFAEALSAIEPSNLEPPRAFSDICDAASLPHDSYEISCVASILDKVNPSESRLNRYELTNRKLKESGFD